MPLVVNQNMKDAFKVIAADPDLSGPDKAMLKDRYIEQMLRRNESFVASDDKPGEGRPRRD